MNLRESVNELRTLLEKTPANGPLRSARRLKSDLKSSGSRTQAAAWLSRVESFLASEELRLRYPPNVSAAVEAVYRDLITLVDVHDKLEAEVDQLVDRLENTPLLP